MPCIEPPRTAAPDAPPALHWALITGALLAGCASTPMPAMAPAPASARAPAPAPAAEPVAAAARPVAQAPVSVVTPVPPPAPRAAPQPAPSPPGMAPGTAAAPPTASVARASLPPPGTPRSHSELQSLAARRMVAANPGRTYMGKPPEPLLAIPVLEIELNGNGSVRRIDVVRKPSDADALDTVQLAIDAVHRAAPFGEVSHLPRPWKFREVFLFDDDRRFKPATLDR